MLAIDDVLAQPNGARFFRADLHIHSYGASHDVNDVSMTPDAIVQTAKNEGIDLVSITDHNEIGNVEAALHAATRLNVLVIPGVELSTSDGHLLCYLPTLEALQRFHASVAIVDRGTQNSRCQTAILECLNLLRSFGGFGVLAHVDVKSGFETEVPGASPHKVDVLCHAALLGIELKQPSSPIFYAEGDPNSERVRIGKLRIDRLQLGSKQHLARVQNSDAHALKFLGRNAAQDRKVTRYKMDAPSFVGLRIALENGDARVRMEEQIPSTIPRFVGIHFEGGFLADQVIQFSPNLNCIVGGRGTGKSTAFEAVRCLAAGRGPQGNVVDSEVWPHQINVFWRDQAGQQHNLVRPKDAEIYHADEEDGPCEFEVDCFGQGEAARISIDAQTDPLALLRYLDKFVPLADAVQAEDEAREQLLQLQTEIEKAKEKVEQIPQYERLLVTTKQQLAALQKPEVKELIELQRQLATEREVRAQIAAQLQLAKRDTGRTASKNALNQIREIADAAQLTVGKAEFSAIHQAAEKFAAVIDSADAQVKKELTGFEALVVRQAASWKAKEDEAQKKIDAKRRELEALKIALDMSYITKLAKDEASHAQSVKNLSTWKPHLQQKRAERRAVLQQRWAARERVATLRDAFAKQATETLKEALADLQVTLKYTRNAYSPDAADLIIQTMGWRTNQQTRAAWLVEELTVPSLLDAIQKEDSAPIVALRTKEGAEIFKQDEAKQILSRLGAPEIQFALERARLYDVPRLHVTRQLPDGKGGARRVVREFSKLSLGQQQSVLLALILSANSNHPLIIDQPEDNLDGEFIYSTLVPVLRRAKERRQVIVVTHNPNVAVLGDAEQIVVMKALNDRGGIVARGSIDDEKTRDAACAILEGAREAFLRKAKMYGVLGLSD